MGYSYIDPDIQKPKPGRTAQVLQQRVFRASRRNSAEKESDVLRAPIVKKTKRWPPTDRSDGLSFLLRFRSLQTLFKNPEAYLI